MTTVAADIVPEPYPTIAAATWQPERRLMIAVLEDAIECWLANLSAARGIRRARFAEVAAWFRAEDRAWPFSFVNICDACSLDPAVIRRMLARKLRAHMLGTSGKPAGWGGSSAPAWSVPGGRTYTRPSGSIWKWNVGVPSRDQLASVAGGNATA